MRYIFITISFLLVISSCKSSSKLADSAIPAITIVSFNSICCGVRSDDFLMTFYHSFKEQNQVKLKASKVTGCGKEGEYKIVFYTKDLSSSHYKKFSERLKAIVDKESNKNKNSEDGTLNVETTDTLNVSYCRGGLVDLD